MCVCVEIVVSQQVIEEVSGVNCVSCSLLSTFIFYNTVSVMIHSVLTSMIMLQNTAHTPSIITITNLYHDWLLCINRLTTIMYCT